VIAVSQDTLGRQGRPVPIPAKGSACTSSSCWHRSQSGQAFNDTQCANVGVSQQSSVTACQTRCLQQSRCNAINYDGSANGCVLRACPLPIPQPSASAFGPSWTAWSWNGTTPRGGSDTEAQIWSRPLANGDVAVAAHNPTGQLADIAVNLTHWFAPDTRVHCRDLFKRVDKGVFTGQFSAVGVPVHGVTMLRLSLVV
jgi:hypothetical protein